MKGCRKVQGLIAASLYEDLSDRERSLLERHLASCASCRAEAESLGVLISTIPDIRPELNLDLVPLLRRRLNERAARTYSGAWRWALSGAACLVLFGLVTYTFLGQPFPDRTPKMASGPEEVVSPVQTALAEAGELAEGRDFTGAVQVLATAITSYGEDPKAGQAQKLLADIEFDHLRWYAKADEAYGTLAAKYPKVYGNSPESIWRRELLAEARGRSEEYEPLYRIDAATRSRTEAFGKLEEVISQYPGPFIASHAAERMARLVLEETSPPDVEHRHLFAMAQARERCTDPVAVGQLTLEMGHICREEGNIKGARELYVETANNEQTVLAQRQLAQEALSGLGAFSD